MRVPRRRQSGVLVVPFVIVCACVGLAQVQPAADLVVYHDSLSPDWSNWSWNTTVNLANNSPTYGSSQASISARFDAAWAGLYLHTDSALGSDQYKSVRFAIHGGAGGQALTAR